MLSVLLALALAADPARPAAPAGRVVSRVAAVVNGEAITLRELTERAGPDWSRVEAMPAGADRDRARAALLKQIFDLTVAERLLEAQVKELGIEIGEAQVEAAIADIKKRERIDEDGMARALAEQGQTRESFAKQIRRTLEARGVLQQKIGGKIKVTDEDVKAYYQQHEADFVAGHEIRVRNILFPVAAGASPADEAAARARAEATWQRLAAGEDFAQVARAVSAAPSASEGGDLGWLRRGVLEREVEAVAFSLEPGRISRVLRARKGFLLLKVEERRGGEARPLDEVKDQIRDRLTIDQAEAYQNQYVAELRKDAVIEIRLPELKD